MPWYLPWSESIKKRACRYLLQRYLGQFLEEKLTLDQLTVDLYNGTGTVSEVRLDVQALNELGEQQNLPFEFVDGYISEMSVSIPWSSLLSDSSYVEVAGMVLTIQPKQRADSGVSMFESMWSSMTSSMQLAEECLKQTDGKDADQAQPLEGLELFAQTIDSILSRVKVKFVDTVVRLEHVPKDSNSGVAVEFRIKNVDYFDEAGTDPPTPPPAEAALQQGNKLYQVAAFATKKFCLEGVKLYTDEFPSRARTFSRSVMSLSTVSTPDSDFATAPATPQSPERPNVSLEPDPVLFGRLAGRQEVRLRLKQGGGVVGPKVDLEITLGALAIFLSPRQLHVLAELVHGLASPDLEDTSNVAPRARCVEKPMDPTDFRRVEQELQQQLQPPVGSRPQGLQCTQGWSTASLDDSDDEFLPMRGPMSDSAVSTATSMDTSLCSSVSSSASSTKVMPLSSRMSSAGINTAASHGASFQQNMSYHTRKKSHKGPAVDADPAAETSHFHVRLSSLAAVLLHDDVLTLCAEGDGLARSSVQQMKSLAEDFFAELGCFAVSGYGQMDIEQAREVFLRACQLNHIRLLAAPVIVEGTEKTTSNASCVSATLTAASVELLECLIDKKTATQTGSVEYVELLRFLRGTTDNTTFPLGSQPDLRMTLKYSEKTVQRGHVKLPSQPRTDIQVLLQPCCSEVDVSIVDRITALLNPQPLCSRASSKFSAKDTMTQQSCFYQAVVENPTAPESKTDVKISSSLLTLKLRFPTPDLRPIHDMDRPPWWKRSVRKDFLMFELTDATFLTSLDSREPCQRFEVQCRDIHGSFQEADTDTSVPFIHASVDDKNGNSLPDGGQGFGWPRIVVQVFPVCSRGDLDHITEMDSEESLRQSLVEPLETTTQREPSPFSSKRTVHESDTPHAECESEGEELVVPGDKQEMAEFVEHASRNCRIQLDINLPCASAHLSSKHLYELIYNRINTDMFLWEPAAPKPKSSASGEFYSTGTPVGVDLASTMDSLYPAFTMCKSGIQYDSDSDSEDTDGAYYSVYEQRQRQRRQQQQEAAGVGGQSHIAVSVNVGQGVLSVIAPVRDAAGLVLPGQCGELELQLEDAMLFSVSGYQGVSGRGYVCVTANSAALYHCGLAPLSIQPPQLRPVGAPPSAHLLPTIYRSEAGAVLRPGPLVGVGGGSLDMLAIAVRIQVEEGTHNLKTFRVAAGLRGATLRHRMCAGPLSWFTQMVDFFDVLDYPVAGYAPPGVITELHAHLWDCAVDYRPERLSTRVVLAAGSLSVSSNIAAQTSTSTLRLLAEDAALLLSARGGSSGNVDLRRDYVCVADLGLFELSLRLCDRPGAPRADLRASNNALHVRTCADSGRALADLLAYLASDGDLAPPDREESPPPPDLDNNQNDASGLSKSQVDRVHDMMEEAMRDTNGFNAGGKPKSPRSHGDRRGVEVFFFPDESHPLPPRGDVELSPAAEEDDNDWEDDFCMVDKEAGCGILLHNGLPEVRVLALEPVRVVDNHFGVPIGKSDLLRAPKHYPAPVLRYTLREMNVVWHMYGGRDFGGVANKKQVKIDEGQPASSPTTVPAAFIPYDHHSNQHAQGTVSFSKSSPSEVRFGVPSSPKPKPTTHMPWQVRGGPGRQHDVLMELQLNKVRFQHELYPETAPKASRQVLLVGEVEVRDRLATSHINKFLYQHTSEARPRQAHANMVVVKAVHVRPDPRLRVQECCLKVSVLPLRLNIDQDSLLFLLTFFSEVSGVEGSEDTRPGSRHTTPTHHAPVMTVAGDHDSTPMLPPEPPTLLILLEEEAASLQEHTSQPLPPADPNDRPPIFFRSFEFSPDVPIRLDYQGKRVDMTHGPLAGLLMGLGQLNCSELRLKRLSYRHGLLGFDKLVTFVLSEWLQDIKKNQLPSLLGGVGPMHALVQLFQGIRDLFWLPIEQYQKDGRIVRGLQRGANSFTTSTAMAALELTSRLVQAIQSTAEMAYDMVSPGPSVRRRLRGSRGKRRRYTQPADLREGMANAYLLVKEGLGETAQTIVRVASEEHEQKGVSGAVGGVLRQIPPTVVKPIILATEATSNVLGGMRSQLVPDARREAAEKWRAED